MFWADKTAKGLAATSKPQLVDDAKTPSGRVHVGALRGVIIHDLIFKALREAGVRASYTFIIDDLDPMDDLPTYLPREKYEQYIGVPLKNIPVPTDDSRFEPKGQTLKAKSYAEYYANEFTGVFNKLGVTPDIFWNSQLYKTGKLDGFVKLALDNAEKIQEIYDKVSGSRRPRDFVPFQPICENCGRIGTTVADKWDGKAVYYMCSPNKVTWAVGCGYKGKVPPFGGTGKMPFRVEWPAKWAALGVTVEGEGKDHASKGGTRDTANAICKEIFNYEPPYDIPYEHFLLSGQKMSSSKGIGVSAVEVAEILPPEVLRFLMVRFRPMQHIDFNPEAPHTIPKLFDDFDTARKSKEAVLKRVYELALAEEKKGGYFVPRFTDLVNMIQMPNVDIHAYAENQKGEKLTSHDWEKIDERVRYVKIYLERFAPEEIKFTVREELPEQARSLTQKQKDLLQRIAQLVDEAKEPEKFQNDIYQTGKEIGLSSEDAFEAIYLALLGKESGPKAAWLILSLDKEFVKRRLEEAVWIRKENPRHNR